MGIVGGIPSVFRLARALTQGLADLVRESPNEIEAAQSCLIVKRW